MDKKRNNPGGNASENDCATAAVIQAVEAFFSDLSGLPDRRLLLFLRDGFPILNATRWKSAKDVTGTSWPFLWPGWPNSTIVRRQTHSAMPSATGICAGTIQFMQTSAARR